MLSLINIVCEAQSQQKQAITYLNVTILEKGDVSRLTKYVNAQVPNDNMP